MLLSLALVFDSVPVGAMYAMAEEANDAIDAVEVAADASVEEDATQDDKNADEDLTADDLNGETIVTPSDDVQGEDVVTDEPTEDDQYVVEDQESDTQETDQQVTDDRTVTDDEAETDDQVITDDQTTAEDGTEVAADDDAADQTDEDQATEETATEESTDAAAEEELVILTYEDDALVVTVEAKPGVLPENTRVEAEEIQPVSAEKADAYGEALSALSEALREEDKGYSDAKVYDIRLLDGDGIEFEPNGEVTVKLDYKSAQPMGDEAETVEVAHLTNEGDVQMMDATVDTNASGDVEAAEFTTDGFSYYIVFGRTPGSTTEPANIGQYGWIKFATNGVQDTTPGQNNPNANWGYYANDNALPALGTNEAYHRILQVNLWVKNNGADDDDYENGYTHVGAAQYLWTWDNTVRVDDFDLPDYEVLHTHMHTAWDDGANDRQNDSLIDTYNVRGYQSSDNTSSDLNVLDVYVKPAIEPQNAMRYIIRYVHADGSVSDGNVRYLGSGQTYSFNAEEHRREGDELYAGMSVITGVDGLSTYNTANGTGTFRYNGNVDLAKVYVYYKKNPDAEGTTTRSRFDKDANGKYYTGDEGLYINKEAEQVNGREFLVNLEAWNVKQAASVGMVLDASGSMAWTAGEPIPIQKTSAEWDEIFGNHGWSSSSYTSSFDYHALSDAQVRRLQDAGVLDISRCDNSSMGYSGYHYYIKSNRTTINEYVALGYTDGTTQTRNGVTFYRLGVDGSYEGFATRTRNLDNGSNAGWYYVNSSGNTDTYHAATGKSYDGIASRPQNNANRGAGPSKFYIDNQGRLCCIFSDGRKNAAGNDNNTSGSIVYNVSSPVYEKRETMFTKCETLQDATAQFGAILLGASPESQIGMTRFSQQVKNESGNFRNTSYLPLLNWTSNPTEVAAALNLTAGGYGNTSHNDDGLTVYEYGLTGQTRTWTGVQAYIDYLSNIPGQYDQWNNQLTAPNHKYLIIFTDGKDTNGDADSPTQGETGRQVRILKNNGYTVITVLMKSLGMETSGQVVSTRDFLQQLASSDVNGNKLYFEASSDSAHDMVEEFRKIATYIGTGLHDYSVRDYIDPRFDVINEAGDVLTVLDENGNFTAGVDANGLRGFTTPDGKQAQLGYDSARKMFYVLWQEQDIPSTDLRSTETVNLWKSQIRLQAKDDFLGGDDVLTNGNEPGTNNRPGLNGVYKPAASDPTGYTPDTSDPTNKPYKDFPYATVDVATDLLVDSYEDTVFSGENVSPYALFQKLEHTWTDDELANAENHEYRSESYFDYLARLGKKYRNDPLYYLNIVKNGAVPDGYQPLKDANNQPIESITVSGNTLTMQLPYFYLPKVDDNSSYAGGDKHQADKVGNLTYTWVATEDNRANAPFADGVIGTNEEQNNQLRYDLTINYTPDDFSRGADAVYPTDDGSTRTRALTGLSPRNALIRDNVGTTAADQEEEGVAVIHVVDGRIALEKRVNKKDLQEYLDSLGSETVTFTYSLTGASKDDITFTLSADSTYTEDGDEAILFSGAFAGTEDTYAWTQLDQGEYSVSETISDSGSFKAPTYEGYQYDGTDKRTEDYDDVPAFLASQTGQVTVHIGTVNSGKPSATSYVASFEEASDKAAPTRDEVIEHYDDNDDNDQTDKPKRVDPELAQNNGKAYLNAQIGAVKITNELKKTDLTIEKVDENNHATKLAGVTFLLKRLDGEGTEVAVDNGEQTTGANGRATFAGLSAGTYHLYETDLGDNDSYTLPSNDSYWTIIIKGGTIDSVVDPKGTAVTTIGTGANLAYVLENGKVKPSIEITKVDATDSTVPLEGAQFQLRKVSGNTTTNVGDPVTTDADGKARFENLETGTDYVITEIAAPDGWTVREDIHFSVATDGTITIADPSGAEYDSSDPMSPTLGEGNEQMQYPLTVPDLRVYALPAAGGPGVYPFLLAGAFAAAYAASGAGDERRKLSQCANSRSRAAGPLGGG